MKTTVELPDALLREAKAYAAPQGVPMREVFERGLRAVLDEATKEPFNLKTVTTNGEGMVRDYSWQEVLDIIYDRDLSHFPEVRRRNPLRD